MAILRASSVRILFAVLLSSGIASSGWAQVVGLDTVHQVLYEAYVGSTPPYHLDPLQTRLMIQRAELQSATLASEPDCDPSDASSSSPLIRDDRGWFAVMKVQSGELSSGGSIVVDPSATSGASILLGSLGYVDRLASLDPSLAEARRLPAEEIAKRYIAWLRRALKEPEIGSGAPAGGGGSGLRNIDWELVEESARDAVLVDRFLSAEGENWRPAAKEAARHWDLERQKAFAQSLGGWLADNYDRGRAGKGFTGGALRGSDLLEAIRSGQEAGVCRDIASFQGEVLREMGWKDVYVLAYTSAVPHSTVIARHPSQNDKLVRFNYDLVTEAPTGTEIASISQPDQRGHAYWIFEPGGKLVGQLPSELGAWVADATGANLEDIDVFIDPERNRLARLAVSSGRFDGYAFTGEASGTNIVGVAGGFRYHDPESDPASGSVTFGTMKQSGGPRDFDLTHVYGRFAQRLNSPWLGPGDALRARIESSLHVSANWAGGGAFSGLASTNVGVHLQARSRDDDSRLDIRGVRQYVPGFKDVRDMSLSTVRLYPNLTYVSLQGEKRVSKEWSVVGDAILGYRHFGPQLDLRAGARHRPSGSEVKGGFRGRIDPDAPDLAWGASRRLSVEGTVNAGKGWVFKGAYEHPLEGPDLVRGSVIKRFRHPSKSSAP